MRYYWKPWEVRIIFSGLGKNPEIVIKYAYRRSIGIDLMRTIIVRLEIGQWLNMLLEFTVGNKWTKVIVPMENNLVTIHPELELGLKSPLPLHGASQYGKCCHTSRKQES